MDHPAWRRLTRAEYEASGEDIDHLVLETPGIDRFCSTTIWSLSAYDAFGGEEPMFWHHPWGYACFTCRDSPFWGRMFMPLEASWCLASPLITHRPQSFARAFTRHIQKDPSWDSLFFSGLPENGQLWQGLLAAFHDYPCYRAQPAVRCQASLVGGLDGYLGRRSAKFRKNMRRASRLSKNHGVRLTWQADWQTQSVSDFFQKAMTIEARSWKGLAGEGVNHGHMYRFYAQMLPRLAERGCLRTVTATIDDQWVGYAFGGVWGSVFRGLQFSFLQDWHHLSLGNLMQMKLIAGLSKEPITLYDLGMDMAYKRAWSEVLMTTHALLVRK